jgi:hypothetical protein
MNHSLPHASEAPAMRPLPLEIGIGRVDIRQVSVHEASDFAMPIHQRVRRDAIQPRRKRDVSPLVLVQIRERTMKHLRRDVLGIRTVPDAPEDVDVHSVEMAVVQLQKTCWIGTRGSNERALVDLVWRRHHGLS